MRNSEKEKFKYYFKFSHSGFFYQEKVRISKILMWFLTPFFIHSLATAKLPNLGWTQTDMLLGTKQSTECVGIDIETSFYRKNC